MQLICSALKKVGAIHLTTLFKIIIYSHEFRFEKEKRSGINTPNEYQNGNILLMNLPENLKKTSK